MFVVPMFVVPGISLCRASPSTVVPGISFDGSAGHLFVEFPRRAQEMSVLESNVRYVLQAVGRDVPGFASHFFTSKKLKTAAR